ncbi:MAG: ankyrin repeat domain-containing protein [Candidatus Desulfacyla sp.]
MSDRTLEEVLQSTSDCIYPAQLGEATVCLDSADSDGDTPLHILIRRGDTEGALLLIRKGAPVNAAGDMGETPLHAAISKEDAAVIHALLRAGARMDIASEFGETAQQKAARRGIRLLRSNIAHPV